MRGSSCRLTCYCYRLTSHLNHLEFLDDHGLNIVLRGLYLPQRAFSSSKSFVISTLQVLSEFFPDFVEPGFDGNIAEYDWD